MFSLACMSSIVCVYPLIYQQLSYNKSKGNLFMSDQLERVPSDRIYFQLMEKVGSNHNYQKITLVLWSITTYLCGGIALISPYLLYQDPYDCPTTYANLTCDEYVCSLANEHQKYIPNPSIHSLTNEFGDFRCQDDQKYLSILLLISYSGMPVGFLLTSLFGGSLGRKTLMICCNSITLIGLVLIIFSQNMIMVSVGLFLGMMGGMIGFNFSLFYITETVDEAKRQQFSIIAQLFYGIGALGNVGTFYVIGNWLYIIIFFYLIPVAIVILGIIFLAVDTPMFLVTKKTPQQAYKAFMFIASINGIENPNLTIEDILKVKEFFILQQNQETKQRQFSIFYLFRYPSVRKYTLCLMIVDSSIALLFYAPGLMIDQFQLNIFINGLSVAASEFLAYPVAFLLITRLKRRLLAYICFSTCLICAIILIFIWQPRIDGVTEAVGQNVGVFVLVFLFRFAITLEYTFYCVYSNEVYPTQVRSIGSNFNTMIGGCVITFSPYLIELCLSSGFKIMIIFAIMAILSIIAYCNLPETFEIPPPDIIEELKNQSSTNNLPLTERQLTVNLPSEPILDRIIVEDTEAAPPLSQNLGMIRQIELQENK